MSRKLINEKGEVDFGLYDTPVEEINFREYRPRDGRGKRVSRVRIGLGYKSFHFMGISGPDFMAGFAVVDLGYLANGFAYLFDSTSRELREWSRLAPPLGDRIRIRPTPEDPFSVFRSGSLSVRMDSRGLHMESGGFSAAVSPAAGDPVRPLRLCTRTGYSGWTFTRKASPQPVQGVIRTEGRIYTLDPCTSFAVSDWTGGFLRHETFWNWAAIAAPLPGGHTLGMNLSWGVNETGFTENAFWLDGVMEKVDMVCFERRSSSAGDFWRITSADGRVNLKFHARGSRGEKVNAGLVVSDFTQFFGTFTGTLSPEGREPLVLEGIPGWLEDHFAKW